MAGNAEATTALMGNEVQVLFGSMPAVLSQIRAETITPLAVGTVARSPQLPDTPTMREAGIEGYRASLWLGLAAPAGTPQEAIDRLSEALSDAVSDPQVREQLANNGAEATDMSPGEFRQLIVDELETYGQIVTCRAGSTAGLRPKDSDRPKACRRKALERGGPTRLNGHLGTSMGRVPLGQRRNRRAARWLVEKDGRRRSRLRAYTPPAGQATTDRRSCRTGTPNDTWMRG
jgi:hypothetical protein